MSLFILFRIQAFQNQMLLERSYPGSSEIVREIFKSPNIERRTKSRLYFVVPQSNPNSDFIHILFARTRKIETTEFSDDGTPHTVIHPDSPFVNVFIDLANNVCAIEKKSKFASSVEGAADLFRKLLQESPVVQHHECEILVDPIRDPEEFLKHLKNNTIVTRFYFDVRKPNPIDASEITSALKKVTLDIKAKKSRTSIEGNDLDHQLIKEITRSSASSGDDAGIKFRQVGDSHFVTRSLKNNRIFARINLEEIDRSIDSIKDYIRQLYSRVRHGEND